MTAHARNTKPAKYCNRCESIHSGDCLKQAETNKTPWYCGRCRALHVGSCPSKPKAFQNKRVKRTLTGSKWDKLRELIFKRDRFLCQEHLKTGAVKIVALHGENHGICDHIIPLSEGGTDDSDNLQTLCQGCSEIKSKAERLRGRGGKSF